MPTRDQAAAFRTAQLDKQRAMSRALCDREWCVAALIRGARGALRWFGSEVA